MTTTAPRSGTAHKLAWPGFAGIAALLGASIVLNALSSAVDASGLAPLTFALAVVAFVGALIAWKQPSHRIGWLLLGAMGAMGLTFAAQAYAVYSVSVSRLALTEWAAWLSGWLWIGGVFPFLTFLPLLFPDGLLPSPRWRPFAVAAAVTLAVVATALALQPTISLDAAIAPIRNPIGVPALAGFAETMTEGAGNLLLLVFVVGSCAAVIVRRRRATPVQRLQIKWFVTAVVLLLAYHVATAALELAGIPSPGDTAAGRIGATLTIAFVPVAISIAILKHRLYDIDVIIRRTLLYAALSALLGAAYLSSVVVLQRFLPLRDGSNLAVAVSTLAVASLFRPARSAVQRFIDRRFYRDRYDAAATLQSFAGRMRTQVDDATLRSELLATVMSTMQPASALLWLQERPAGGGTATSA